MRLDDEADQPDRRVDRRPSARTGGCDARALVDCAGPGSSSAGCIEREDGVAVLDDLAAAGCARPPGGELLEPAHGVDGEPPGARRPPRSRAAGSCCCRSPAPDRSVGLRRAAHRSPMPAVGEPGDVEDQRGSTVAEDRDAGEQRDRARGAGERLDDHLGRCRRRRRPRCRSAGRRLDHDDVEAGPALPRRHAEVLGQLDERKQPAAQAVERGAVDVVDRAGDLVAARAARPPARRPGGRRSARRRTSTMTTGMIASVSGTLSRKTRPCPARTRPRCCRRPARGRAHDVHADAAARDVGDLVLGGQARAEHQVESLLALRAAASVARQQRRRRRRARPAAGGRCRARRRPPRCGPARPRGTPGCAGSPSRSLPAATRSAGSSMPWSTALRTRCRSGSRAPRSPPCRRRCPRRRSRCGSACPGGRQVADDAAELAR